VPKPSISWLNQAEIEIGLLARQCLANRRNSDTGGPAARNGSMERQGKPRLRKNQLAVHSPQGP
jgi:hypothetical protein